MNISQANRYNQANHVSQVRSESRTFRFTVTIFYLLILGN